VFALGLLIVVLRQPDLAAPTAEEVKSAEELASLQADAARYAEQFAMIQSSRPVTWEDLEVLDLAIEAQRAYITGLRADLVPSDLQKRQADLQEQYDTAAGRLLRSDSEMAAQRARELAAGGQAEAAISAMEEAIQLQDRINREFARGEFANRARLKELELEKGKLEVMPLVQRLRNLRQDADLAFAQENYEVAATKRREALHLARTIAADFAATRSVRADDIVALERQVQETEAAMRQRQIKAREAKALRLAENGEIDSAASEIRAAQELLRNLQRDFPTSSFATAERAEELEATRQTILSQELGKRAIQLEVELRQALRQQRMEAAKELAGRLWATVDQLNSQYKLSRFRDEGLLVRARYLNLIRDQFAPVHAAARAELLAVPGRDGVRMARHETSQRLFRQVMGSNPSSRALEDGPVESVTWGEAEEFCERLGWILAAEVKLPDEATFRAALGLVEPTTLEQHVMHAGNSDRQVRPAGSAAANPDGFFDLLGNVEEWLGASNPNDGREALVMGGSVRDPLATLMEIPARFVGKDARDRFRGFRWCLVEAGSDAAQ
jgi:hypothetical protein